MKSCPFSVLPFVFVILSLLPAVFSDLNSDKQALLDFANAIPHRRVGLIGSIPSNTLGKLDALKALSLGSNRLSGSLPSDITSLPMLQYLDGQHNNFSGDIPASFPLQLILLDLSYNSFTGNIPQMIRNLTQLTALNLQNNTLSGPIPDLNLPKLKRLNLSYNHLNGSIPSSLQGFPNSSFVGNPLLCGRPLKACSLVLPPPPPTSFSPPPAVPYKSSKMTLSMGAIITIAAGGSVLLLLL
ncbi:hypothetical protein M0R45_017642 [Rubus argutus]|uniref:Uncharacterized protein n=1 Tax=Rubus argutus TaxID=59490 RepID=A0AAW1XZM9_RUBAR